jgi:hypothetical protein
MIGATEYLSGPTAKDYTNEKEFENNGINLKYKSYDYMKYPQLTGEFQNNVSIIDLIFNCGPDSIKYLKSCTPNIN